jgi:hypothetical protein
MKTVRNLVLAFSFLFLLQNTVFAMSIFDIYRSSGVDQNSSAPAAEKEDSLHSVAVSELQNLSPLLSIQSPSSIRDSIDSFQNSWKLSKEYCFSLPKKEDYRYCKSKLFRQKIEIAERKTILERRKSGILLLIFATTERHSKIMNTVKINSESKTPTVIFKKHLETRSLSIYRISGYTD